LWFDGCDQEFDMKALTLSCVMALCAADALADDKPTAFVLEHVDQWTKSAMTASLLEEAGFDVRPLPLDESPFLFDVDLIVIGSFASEHPGYAQYMREYANDLFNFVDKGHTLLQLTQADQVESEPPFLPTTHGARRSDLDTGTVEVRSASSPLLRGVEIVEGEISFATRRTAWEAFDQQGGFEVILGAKADVDAEADVLGVGAAGGVAGGEAEHGAAAGQRPHAEAADQLQRHVEVEARGQVVA
jgi:hypothetical protein